MKSSVRTGMVAAGNMYLDTGILVKLLTPEPDSAWFERELRGHAMTTSELALVEIKSALFAKERNKAITREQRMRAEAKLAELIDHEILTFKNLNNRVLKKAEQVIAACHPEVPIRALDALHVASCDLAQEFPLCTTDARMHAAAQKIHVPVFPPTLPVKI